MIQRHLRNDQVCIGQCCPRSLGAVIPVSARRQARAVISGWSGY